MRRYAIGLIIYLLALVVVSALASPWVYWGVEEFYPDRWPFRRVFNRVLMVSALVLAWPLARYWGVRWREIGFLDVPAVAVRHWIAGFVLGVICLGVLTGAALVWGHRSWGDGVAWGRLAGFLASGTAVGFFEEILFRGLFFLAVISGLRQGAVGGVAVLGSLFFATAHFVKAADPEGAVHWASGWEVWAGMGGQLAVMADLAARWSCLFLVGVVLCLLTARTRTLWAAMGLHAGWVFGLKSAHALTSGGGPGSFWFPRDLMSGGVALLLLVVLAAWFGTDWKRSIVQEEDRR